jgi:hypothetical protein
VSEDDDMSGLLASSSPARRHRVVPRGDVARRWPIGGKGRSCEERWFDFGPRASRLAVHQRTQHMHAVFSAVLVASEIAIAIFLTARPDAVYQGTQRSPAPTFDPLLQPTCLHIGRSASSTLHLQAIAGRERERWRRLRRKAGPRPLGGSPTVAGGGFSPNARGTL